MRKRNWMPLGITLMALLISGLLVATSASAETVRLSFQGQLADNGEPANNDYDNAAFSGFMEIDLTQAQTGGSGNRFYDLTSWDISLTPVSAGAAVIRFSSGGEADDLGSLTLSDSDDQLLLLVQEDNSPENPRVLLGVFNPGTTISGSTDFEDLLTGNQQQFQTTPVFTSGLMQFAVGESPTGINSASLAVDNNADTRYVDGNTGDDLGGGNSCAVIDNPCATVQRALNAALPGDSIRIADAIYTEILQIETPVSLLGESRDGTILEAASTRGAAADRTVTVSDDVALEVHDLTIRHGNTGLNGGGIECMGGDLALERVRFADNDADGNGAALVSGDNAVVMNDVVFSNNGSSVTSNGGGAFLGENFVVTDVTLNNVRFENNAAAGGAGLKLSNAQTVLNNVLFAGNTSSGEGGGLFYEGSNSVVSSLAITNAAFIGNSASDGGGGLYTESDDTPFDLVNVLFSGNVANLGGAIFNQAGLAAGDRVLTNVTISGNRAQLRGGGIDRPFDMTLRNTIIWNNQDSTGIGTPEATMDDFFSSSIVEVSNSLLQGYTAGAFPGSNNFDGTISASNPDFRGAVNPSAAPTQTGNLRLRLESPVRDQGNNSFITGVLTDLDGEARIVATFVDLGPYEGTDVLFADGFEQSGFRVSQ